MSSKNLNTIIELLLELASGNLKAKGKISSRNDDYDAILTGINILTEELQHTTVSKDYLNSIYKGIADMLFILDKTGKIVEVNESALAMLKIKKDTLLGKSFQQLFNEPSLFTPVMKKIKRDGFYYNFENSIFNSSGESIPVNCTASSLKDKTGKTIGFMFIAKDMTKIKQTEEALLSKNKELDTFLYKAAHDLKSPITTIQGLLNIAHMEVKDPIALNYFELIRKSTLKLDAILIALKDTVETDIKKTKVEKVNLSKLVEETLVNLQTSNYYSPLIPVRKIFRLKYPIHTNHKSISVALFHILENAYKFRSYSSISTIELIVSQTKEFTKIEIIDKGIGIEKKYQDKIFEMFYKANTDFEGAGLGLYSAKSVLTRIGGTISVISKPRKGASFTLLFPSQLKK